MWKGDNTFKIQYNGKNRRRISMVYKFSLPPELMGKMVEIRDKTKKPLAQQVREAVKEYCDREEKEGER